MSSYLLKLIQVLDRLGSFIFVSLIPMIIVWAVANHYGKELTAMEVIKVLAAIAFTCVVVATVYNEFFASSDARHTSTNTVFRIFQLLLEGASAGTIGVIKKVKKYRGESESRHRSEREKLREFDEVKIEARDPFAPEFIEEAVHAKPAIEKVDVPKLKIEAVHRPIVVADIAPRPPMIAVMREPLRRHHDREKRHDEHRNHHRHDARRQ